MEDRAGTAYFYLNTILEQWDESGSAGACYGNSIFQTESNNDTVSASNNLFLITNANTGNPSSYLIGATHGAYANGGASTVSGTYLLGTNQVSTGWSQTNSYPLVSGSSADWSGWTAEANASVFPSTFPPAIPFSLQAGSSAIGAATTLPGAVSSNTLGVDFTPTQEIGGTARTSLVDLGAMQYSGPSSSGSAFSGGVLAGGIIH